MEPVISKEERNRWPSQLLPRPQRRLPEPWTHEMLVGIPYLRHHALSPDGSEIAFIWDREDNSDIWLMASDNPCWPRRLTFNRPACTSWTDLQPRWSPDGKALVYVSKDEIWMVPTNGRRARKLTDYGHESTSPIFSPDGQRVFFVSKRDTYNNLCYTSPKGDWPTGLTRYETDVSDPRPAPGGKELAFVFHPREDFNRSEICILTLETGEVRHLGGEPLVWDFHPRWSPGGESLAYTSNRTGWRQIYRYDIGTGETAALTEGESSVQGFSWSPDGRRLAYTVNVRGSAELKMLELETRQTRPLRTDAGWHSFPQWSPDGSWLTVEFDSPCRPTDIWRIEVDTGLSTALTHSTPLGLEAAGLPMPEFVTYPSTGGASIPAFLYRPSSASAAKPCPAIVYPHGGPTSEHTLEWDMLAQWLVAKGYAVLAPNYRGSTGYGIAHQHALHDRWGIVDTEDMLAAGDYLRGLDWIDGHRMGIVGFSYGSYLSLLALARDSSPTPRFKCGVCAFGDSDILTSWAQGDRIGREDLERQMAHPATNREGYRAGSPIYDVERIRYPLLIFHGDEDRRVHPLQSEQLVEALKRADKAFEYYVYGGEGHGFLQLGNRLHFYRTVERFLDWYLF